jgi:hypothetical protein
MNASPVPPSRGPVADWRLGLETGRVEAQCRKPFRGKQVVHSPSRSLPDAVIRAFFSSLTTTVFSQRSMRRFDTSPAGRHRRAKPSSPAQHRDRSLSYQATSRVRGTPSCSACPH